MNKQQSGFTLIELIMVIVILGILSAFALPRFADLGGDAERATIEAARGAVKSASAIAHASALASNTTDGNLTMEGQTVAVTNGYPTTASICVAAGLAAPDYTCSGGIITTSSSSPSDPCFTYAAAASTSTAPTISALGVMDSTGTACTVTP